MDDFHAAIEHYRVIQGTVPTTWTVRRLRTGRTSPAPRRARWCDDCNDHDASVHVGAREVCGSANTTTATRSSARGLQPSGSGRPEAVGAQLGV